MTTIALSLNSITTVDPPSGQKLNNLINDFELTQLAAKGDMLAFEELYQRHHRRVYSICLGMLHNSHEAEDLTQDVFVQLHRKVGSFLGNSAFTTWLHRLTVNQVLMHFRKRKVKFEKTVEEGQVPETVVPGTENIEKMPIVSKLLLVQALEQLPDGYKNVFVLHDIFGYGHKEIAKILGFSEGASKSQLFKARRKLRKMVNRQSNPRRLRLD